MTKKKLILLNFFNICFQPVFICISGISVYRHPNLAPFRPFLSKSVVYFDQQTLWSAVNIAKNNGHNVIPENMCQNNVPVVNISESFAEFFDKKVSNIVNQTVISDNVYSGRRKIHAEVEILI